MPCKGVFSAKIKVLVGGRDANLHGYRHKYITKLPKTQHDCKIRFKTGCAYTQLKKSGGHILFLRKNALIVSIFALKNKNFVKFVQKTKKVSVLVLT